MGLAPVHSGSDTGPSLCPNLPLSPFARLPRALAWRCTAVDRGLWEAAVHGTPRVCYLPAHPPRTQGSHTGTCVLLGSCCCPHLTAHWTQSRKDTFPPRAEWPGSRCRWGVDDMMCGRPSAREKRGQVLRDLHALVLRGISQQSNTGNNPDVYDSSKPTQRSKGMDDLWPPAPAGPRALALRAPEVTHCSRTGKAMCLGHPEVAVTR